MVSMGLCNACCNGSNTDFTHQLDADTGARVDILKVEDQLGDVFNTINIVVRGRRNQRHAWRGVANPSDVVIHLVTRQLTTFTGLSTLRHFDLQLIGVDQIVCRHTKTATCNLLNR